jgi:MFS family permease
MTNDAVKANNSPLRAFKNRNFRLFWCGQIISLVGSWMQGLAQGWLILVLVDPQLRAGVMAHHGDATAVAATHLTASAQAAANYWSGVVNFAGGLPMLMFALFAGVIIDRVNKHRLLILTQAMLAICACILGALISYHVVTVHLVVVMALVLGVVMAFDMPTRQSFVARLVGRNDMSSAVVLNSSMFNAARALGPAVGGYLLASHVSIADCFYLNGLSYIPVIAALMMMRGKDLGAPTQEAVSDEKVGIFMQMKEGIQFVRSNHTVKNLLILVGTFGTFAFSFNILIPTLVRYTFLAHSSSAAQVSAFGRLETVRGVGALVGAVIVGLFSTPKRQKYMLIGGSLVATGFLVAFGFSRNIVWVYIWMAIVSCAFIIVFATSNTLVQLIVPDALRGRVLSIYTVMFIGTTPVGSLIAGLIAKNIGAPKTTIIFASLSLAIAIFICFRKNGLRSLEVHEPAPRSASARPHAQEKTAVEAV